MAVDDVLNIACAGIIAGLLVLIALRLLYVRRRGAPARPPQRRPRRTGSGRGRDDDPYEGGSGGGGGD